MKVQRIEEHHLDKLLNCLYDKFNSSHGANTSKLDSCVFYVTDRMSCAKVAGLNFTQEVTGADGQVVQMHKSGYVDAIKTLEERGLVKWMKATPLAFNLTIAGYNRVVEQRSQPVLSRWERVQGYLNSHTGLIALVAIVAGGFFTWLFSNK